MTETRKKSEAARAFAEDGELKTHVGGQALIEGIMMRGKYNWSVAVREPEGSIYTEEHDLSFGKDKTGWLYWPFIRGCRAFVESLALGYKALSIAAEHAFVEEGDEVDSVPGGGDEAPGLGVGRGESVREPRGGRSALPEGPVNAAGSAGDAECPGRESEEGAKGFSWKRDFGNPDEMIDGLLAQRTLEVVDGDTGLPVALSEDAGDDREGSQHGQLEGAPCPDPQQSEGCQNAPAPSSSEPALSSSELAPSESSSEQAEKKPLLGDKEMAISMVLGLVLGIVLFVVVPAAVTNLIVGEYDDRTLLWNIVDGILRIAVFIFYIWLIGRMQDIKRMFGYHGAEHKTIHCFEHGLPLTPENARSFPRLHVRCGTAFLIMVMIIAIFVYTVVPLDALIAAWGVPDGAPKLVLVIIVRILLMPLIAGIAYEITVKWAGSHPGNPIVKVVLWPGMQMQRLTTREPDDGQIECAIAAMKLVLEREELEEAS